MDDLFSRYPALLVCRHAIQDALTLMKESYSRGGKILVCGNGGSCADAEHIVGELMKGFLKKRPVGSDFMQKLKSEGFEDADFICAHLQGALPAISLPSQSAILSAFINDVSPEMAYAQMVYGYGNKNDLFIGLSTSGNSKNVVFASKVAKAKGLACLALTGACESELSKICDVTIQVPETETFKIQELHLPIYHYLCVEVEKSFFP